MNSFITLGPGLGKMAIRCLILNNRQNNNKHLIFNIKQLQNYIKHYMFNTILQFNIKPFAEFGMSK